MDPIQISPESLALLLVFTLCVGALLMHLFGKSIMDDFEEDRIERERLKESAIEAERQSHVLEDWMHNP